MASDAHVANVSVLSASSAATPVMDIAHIRESGEAEQKSVSEAEWEREREAAANLQSFAQQPPEEVNFAANGKSEENYDEEKSMENTWEADTGTGGNTGAGDGEVEDEGLEEGEATSPVGRDPRKAGREWTQREIREYERDSRAVRSDYESSMAGKKRAREKDSEYRNNNRRERYEEDQHRYSDRIGGERNGGGDRYSHRGRDDYDSRRGRREKGSRWSRKDHGDGEYYGEREYYERRGRDRGDYGDRYREESPYEESKRQRKECYRCGGRNHIVMVCTSTERDACKNLSLPKCSRCDGRGHAPDNCPTVVNANPCYRCRQPGHFARNCPYDAPDDPPPQQHHHRSQSHSQQHSVGGMPDAAAVTAQLYGFSTPAQLYAALGMANGYSAAAYGYPVPNTAAAAAAWGSYADYGTGGGRGGHGGHGSHGSHGGHGGHGNQGSHGGHGNHGSDHGGMSMSDRRGMGRGDRSHRDAPQGRGPRTQIGRCFRCGEDGHWTRDCPMRPADADPSGCYKCGKPGHKSRECNACYQCGQDGHRAADCHRR